MLSYGRNQPAYYETDIRSNIDLVHQQPMAVFSSILGKDPRDETNTSHIPYYRIKNLFNTYGGKREEETSRAA